MRFSTSDIKIDVSYIPPEKWLKCFGSSESFGFEGPIIMFMIIYWWTWSYNMHDV
jgi:hypothetical protein